MARVVFHQTVVLLAIVLISTLSCVEVRADSNLSPTALCVKIFGAGGLRGLESYQTGVLISDEGYVLTAWS